MPYTGTAMNRAEYLRKWRAKRKAAYEAEYPGYDGYLVRQPCGLCLSAKDNRRNHWTGVIECDNPVCRYQRALAKVPNVDSKGE